MSPEQEKLSEETGEQARVIMRDIKRLGLDCGDQSCQFATKKIGMRTNSHCRCLDNPTLRRLIVSLIKVIRSTPAEVFEEGSEP